MGTLKFYKPMQAIWEAEMFTTQEYDRSFGTSSIYDGTHKLRYCDATNGLDGFLYVDSNLSTPASTAKKFPVYTGSVKGSPFCFNIQHSGDTTDSICGTSNTTHDLSRVDFSNKVADVSITSSISENGSLHLSAVVTNNGENTVTIKAFERSRTFYFNKLNTSSNSEYYWFLAWAYYLDEADWVELEAGESKLITIKITLNDLTA